MAFGAADMSEALNGYNPVKDKVFNGDATAYGLVEWGATIFASVGTGYVSQSVCFVEGTPVLTEDGLVPIETVTVGCLVWAWDEDSGTSQLQKVVQTFVNEADELVHVFVKGNEIVCTNEHPFYLPKKGWTAACELRAGDILVTVNGQYVVVEKIQHEILEKPIRVYNFEVEKLHTYFIASVLVLVHNSCTNTARRQAVKKAWQNEYNNVKTGGKGISRIWSSNEINILLKTGKVPGYQGHHMYSVKWCIENGRFDLIADPNNIQFLSPAEHFAAHAYKWATETVGRYVF